MMSDLKELEELTKRLDDQERMFSAFFNLSHDAMVVYSITTGMFMRVNQTWTDIMGYTNEEMRQFHYDDIAYPDDIPATIERVEARRRGEDPGTKTFRNRYITKDGRIVTFEWRGSEPFNGLIFSIARPVD